MELPSADALVATVAVLMAVQKAAESVEKSDGLKVALMVKLRVGK
jgi:hypothetical protein